MTCGYMFRRSPFESAEQRTADCNPSVAPGGPHPTRGTAFETNDISIAEKLEILSQLQDVSAPGTWSKAYSCKPGDGHYCVIMN
jgi:hypothetical protein